MGVSRVAAALLCGLAVGGWLQPHPAHAGAEPTGRLAVIAPVSKGLPSAEARRLTDALAAYAVRLGKLTPTSSRPINSKRLGLFVGCAGWGDACALKIGRAVKAQWALSVTVSASSTARGTVVIKLLRVADKKVFKSQKAAMGKATGALAAMDLALFRLFGVPRGPALLVSGSPKGAVIKMDGHEVGEIPLTIAAGLSAGTHRLRISAPGYKDIERKVKLRDGRITRLDLTLKRLPREKPTGSGTPDGKLVGGATPPPPPKSSSPIYKKWWFWTGIAVVAGGATATVLLLKKSGGSSPPPGMVRTVVVLRWP